MSDEALQSALWDLALRILAQRDYSQLELQAKLRRKIQTERNRFPQGNADRAIRLVIAHLTEKQYLDDRRYALAVARRDRSRRHHGDARIGHDLRGRRIDGRIIAAVLSEISDGAEALREAIESYVARRGEPSSRAGLQHLYRYLIRLGHGASDVRQGLSPFFKRVR